MPQPEIFYVLNSRWPTIKAYGLQVAKTCQGLKQSGAKVRLIVPMRARHAQIKDIDPFDLYGIRDQFRLIRLPSFDFTRFHLNGKALFFIQQTTFAFGVALSLLFKKGAVYSRDPFALYLLSFFRRDIFWEAHRFPANPRSRMYRRLMRHASGIVIITRGLEKLFREHGVPPERLTVIADAVDPEEFAIPQTTEQARQELALPSNVKIIGYVGQLSTLGEDKGIGDLLRAFLKLHRVRSETVLLIVGGNDKDIARYRSMAQELGLGTDQVIFAGHQPHGRIPLYLRAADILVMPFPYTEHYAHYMSPLKLFEYMAAKKPIVTTDLPSVREVVAEEHVYFSEPGDPEDLAQTLLGVIDNPGGAQQKIHAIEQLLPRYTWRARGERILAFIASCSMR